MKKTIEIEVFQKGKSIYKGDWRKGPVVVKDYIESAYRLMGKDDEKLLDYLKNRPDPTSLLYQGYSYKVVE